MKLQLILIDTLAQLDAIDFDRLYAGSKDQVEANFPFTEEQNTTALRTERIKEAFRLEVPHDYTWSYLVRDTEADIDLVLITGRLSGNTITYSMSLIAKDDSGSKAYLYSDEFAKLTNDARTAAGIKVIKSRNYKAGTTSNYFKQRFANTTVEAADAIIEVTTVQN
jgi:hypothetical protein